MLPRALLACSPKASDPDHFWKVVTVSSGPDGKSKFGELHIPMPASPGGNAIGALSDALPVKRLKFRETPAEYDFEWHNAPAKMFIACLDAPVRVTVSDGSAHTFAPGEVMYVEDLEGEGHYSVAVGEQARRSLFIEVDDAALPLVDSWRA